MDAQLCEANGPELVGHREAGFGDAVFAAIDRRGVSGERGDEDQLVAAREGGFAGIREPVARGQLREEIGPLEIHRQNLVENILRGLGDVGPDARGDAGVVDQSIELTEGAQCLVHQAGPVGGVTDISADNGKSLAGRGCRFGAGGGGLLCGGAVVCVMNGHAVPCGRQPESDTASEAATRTCDKDIGVGNHRTTLPYTSRRRYDNTPD